MAAEPLLTGRQKRTLRSLGQKLDPRVTVGAAGLTEAVVQNTDAAIAAAELIKVHLREGTPAQRRVQIAQLADAIGAAVVGGTGRKFLLYRPNPGLPPERRMAGGAL